MGTDIRLTPIKRLSLFRSLLDVGPTQSLDHDLQEFALPPSCPRLGIVVRFVPTLELFGLLQ